MSKYENENENETKIAGMPVIFVLNITIILVPSTYRTS